MFYALAYFFLAGLAISGDYWQLAFWIALVLSLNFATLYVLTRSQLKDAKSYTKCEMFIRDSSPMAALVPDEPVVFDQPEQLVPGTYGTRRDYGHRDEDLFIDFSRINPDDVRRLQAALGHIDRMMGTGRACFVEDESGFKPFLVTRAGSRGLNVTYIREGDAVTELASNLGRVIISPKPTQTQEGNE